MSSISYFLPFNWRQVKSNVWPSEDVIRTKAQQVETTSLDVPVYIDPRGDITEIRSWLAENVASRFKMFGHFEIEEFDFRTERTYHGVVFRFTSVTDALHFKMRWFESEHAINL